MPNEMISAALSIAADAVVDIIPSLISSADVKMNFVPLKKEHSMTQVMPDCARQLRRTKAQLARVLSWSLQPDSLLVIRNVSVSKWSPAEQLEHLNRVNLAILQALQSMQEGPNPIEEPAVNDGVKAFLANGIIERGKHTMPAFSAPQEQTLGEIRRDCRAVVDGFAKLDAEALAKCHGTKPHPILGPLTAEQWLRTTEIHTFHHLQILCETVGGNL